MEEGEILTCIECDAELEVVQIHPVRLNVISEDEEEDEEEGSENGDEGDEFGDEDLEDEEEEEEE